MARIRHIFGIDFRSLALFRISLGLMLIVDLLMRMRDLTAFYTDNGVLSVNESIRYADNYRLSIHWMSGLEWVQVTLFLVALLVAFLLMVGYRTRIISILSWFLLMSLQNRNEFITGGGDNLIMILSFWAMFLPIGARWPVDAALDKRYQNDCNADTEKETEKGVYFSGISIALLLQVMYLYFFTAILKTGDAWRVDMDAAWYAVQLDQVATVVGHWLRNFPSLLTFGTYFVWYLEIVAIFLIFSPIFHVPLRMVILGLLVAMHGAFFLTLHIVLFPFIDFVSLTLFLPSAFWDWIVKRTKKTTKREAREAVKIYYDEDCGFCKKTCLILRTFLLPSTVSIQPAQGVEAVYATMERENSWVVVDYTGKQHVHWHAMQYLFSISFLFKPVGWVMGHKWLMAWGNRLYRWVADNRGIMGKFSELFLPYRVVNTRSSWPTLLLGGFFFYVVTYINVSGVGEWGIEKPKHIYVTERTLRLDQRWDMFAPYPSMYSEMPVMPGHTRSGEEVDAYRMMMEPPSWAWPALLSWEFENYRWRKYIGRIRSHKDHTIRRGYGSYLCRRWNERDIPESDQLASFEIYFLRKISAPYGEERKETKVRSWRHWCFPKYAPGGSDAFLD